MTCSCRPSAGVGDDRGIVLTGLFDRSGRAILCEAWANRRDVVLRFLDVVLASLALVVVAPIMAVIALLILLTSPGAGDLSADKGWPSAAELPNAQVPHYA